MPSEDTKIVEFNQYQKFDRAPFITYAECLIKSLMDVKIILKVHPQQKTVNIFRKVFKYLQYRHLKE